MIEVYDDFDTDNEYGMIIPFDFIIYENGETHFKCVPELKNQISALLNLHSDYLSNEFFIALDKILSPFCDSLGFHTYNEDIDDYYFSYIINNENEINKSSGNKTVKITNGKYENLTSLDINDYLNDSLNIYAVLDDEKIVSVASENLFDVDYDDVIEISVETNSDYTNNGYGRMCVEALTNDILSRGKSVCYVCSHKNLPSIKLCENVGFKKNAVFYSYCAYKN